MILGKTTQPKQLLRPIYAIELLTVQQYNNKEAFLYALRQTHIIVPPGRMVYTSYANENNLQTPHEQYAFLHFIIHESILFKNSWTILPQTWQNSENSRCLFIYIYTKILPPPSSPWKTLAYLTLMDWGKMLAYFDKLIQITIPLLTIRWI